MSQVTQPTDPNGKSPEGKYPPTTRISPEAAWKITRAQRGPGTVRPQDDEPEHGGTIPADDGADEWRDK